MNYLEIIGKRQLQTIDVQDYIDWAVEHLENGVECKSIIDLTCLLLEIFPDIDIAEQYFNQAIAELGLSYPDNKTAIYAYLHLYCDDVIRGKIEPQKAVSELCKICEYINLDQSFAEIYHPIMGVWYYLEEDLYLMFMDEYPIYNTELTILNVDTYILNVVNQFDILLSYDLEHDFMQKFIESGGTEWSMRDYKGRSLYLEKLKQREGL